MLNPRTKGQMDKKGEDETTPAPEAAPEVVPAWAQALLAEVASLKAQLAHAEEAQAGMAETIAQQELQLQQVGNAMVPVAHSQPMKLREPVTYETKSGNMRTDR